MPSVDAEEYIHCDSEYWEKWVVARGCVRYVVIIGAARSGTNMLRDALTSLHGVGTWPCDEIPFVWRYGNAWLDHDELTPAMARPATRRYIRQSFERIAGATRAGVVVEKTCANALRVGFVDAVLPEAQFIHIVRNGMDAVPSAMKRWVASLDLSYLLKKARFVPLAELPYYGFNFVANRYRQLRSKEQRLATWGPRFKGMADLAAHATLAEVCARQWVHCVDSARKALSALNTNRVVQVKYEDFVQDPVSQIERLVRHLDIEANNAALRQATATVSSGSIGKGMKALSKADRSCVMQITRPTLESIGYPIEPL